MGLILDSSVLIASERKGRSVYGMLAAIRGSHSDIEIGISVISLMELAHGSIRAETPQRRAGRLRFIQDLASGVPVYPVTATIGFRAGLIDGESQMKGGRLPLSDLLIGVTALELGFGVGTSNLRHFRLVPGLTVTEL